METVEITISPDGTVEVHVRGIKGPRCAEATRGLREGLGAVTAERRTPEYYEQEGAVRATTARRQAAGR